jgi:2-aminobenzoylacetyl-CoA thioesterase
LIFRKTGPVSARLYVTGFAWSPCYLLAARRPALFEAGFHCMGRLYERDIKTALGSREPEILFLTHVHYDHSGATAYLKKVFPSMRIAASARSGETMKRPNAVSLMARLSANMIGLAEKVEGIDASALIREPFEPFEIDVVLEDGQTLSLGDETVEVLSTPGHTSDLLSYYIPGEKILVATESVGLLWQNGTIGTEFLVDYDAYMTSLRRLAALDVDILCQGHHFVFTGDDVKKFFSASIEAAERFRSDVEALLEAEHGSVDRVVALMKAREYDTNPGIKQPEQAYLLNLKARISHLAEKAARRKAEGPPPGKDHRSPA